MLDTGGLNPLWAAPIPWAGKLWARSEPAGLIVFASSSCLAPALASLHEGLCPAAFLPRHSHLSECLSTTERKLEHVGSGSGSQILTIARPSPFEPGILEIDVFKMCTGSDATAVL